MRPKDRKKRYEAAFGGRKPLDEKTFYEEYFQARGISADVVLKVKHILEEVLQRRSVIKRLATSHG